MARLHRGIIRRGRRSRWLIAARYGRGTGYLLHLSQPRPELCHLRHGRVPLGLECLNVFRRLRERFLHAGQRSMLSKPFPMGIGLWSHAVHTGGRFEPAAAEGNKRKRLTCRGVPLAVRWAAPVGLGGLLRPATDRNDPLWSDRGDGGWPSSPCSAQQPGLCMDLRLALRISTASVLQHAQHVEVLSRGSRVWPGMRPGVLRTTFCQKAFPEHDS